MRVLPAVFCMVLFLGTVQAVGTPVSIEAESITLLDSSSGEGELRALVHENTAQTEPVGSVEFRLNASRVTVETDQANVSVVAGPADYRHDPHTTTRSYVGSVIDGAGRRPGFEFHVFPQRATVSLSHPTCAKIDAPGQESLVREPHVQGARRAPKADVGDATEWTGCTGAATVTVEGNFLLRLWEWDATLTTSDDSTVLRSGREPAAMGAMATVREQFIWVEGATLTIPRLEGSYAVYIAGVTGAAELAQLHEATINGALTEEAVLRGHLALQIEPRGDALAGHVEGAEVLNGATMSPVQAPSGPPLARLWLLFLVVPVAGLGWYLRPVWTYRRASAFDAYRGSLTPASRRERRAAGYLMLALVALRGERHRRCVRLASKARRLAPVWPEPQAVRGRALNRLERFQDALWDLDDAYHVAVDRGHRAEVALEAARACLALGDVDAAKSWVRLGREHDAAYMDTGLEAPCFAVVRQARPFVAADVA